MRNSQKRAAQPGGALSPSANKGVEKRGAPHTGQYLNEPRLLNVALIVQSNANVASTKYKPRIMIYFPNKLNRAMHE